MTKRIISVSRIFPLGSYKNVTYTNGIELDEEPENPVAVMEQLTKEIYLAFFSHSEIIQKMESVKTLVEKAEVFKNESQ